MKLSPPEFIAEKRDGKEHSPEALKAWIDGFLSGEIPEYQVSAWLMAVFFRGMSFAETTAWTKLIAASGKRLPRIGSAFRVDKHSTGGIGDKTSLLLVPLVAAVAEKHFGPGKVAVPMVSGRGLGHTGGTLDKLEAIPGFRSDISLPRAGELLAKQGFCMMGQTADFAPADRLLYAMRDVTATVENFSLITSSILGKKLAEDLDGLVLDVKVGDGAFMKTEAQASRLAALLLEVARACGIDAVAVLTTMDSPLGATVGNALEVDECAAYLRGERRHPELHAVTLELAGWMLRLASKRKVSLDEAKRWCEAALATSRPFELFEQVFSSQGGDWNAYERARDAAQASLTRTEFRATSAGVFQCRALPLGHLLTHLGGGRLTKESTIDPWVGIELARQVGDTVDKGALLLTVVHRGALTPEMNGLVAEAVSFELPREPRGCRVLECKE